MTCYGRGGSLGIGMILAAAAMTIAAAQKLAPQEPTPREQAFRRIYQELVEINTTNSVGDTVRAAEAMAAELKAGGLPADDVHVIASATRKGDLVARLRGTGARKPMLLIAHIDVVEAKREDWDFDPFQLQEVNGYFRGRGSIDDKAMASIFVANLIEYVKEGFKPDRDIILALTTDEELSDSPDDGAHYLLDHDRPLIDAEFAINEGGGGALRNGKPFRMSVQHAEKVYQTYTLEVTDPGGHSASGRRDNAIYRLADALRRLAAFDFPVALNAVTRSFFERTVAAESEPAAAAIKALLAGNTDEAVLMPLTVRPQYNAVIRTTCVPTLMEAGQAENALPQTARATVNCRILPDQPVAEVERTLNRVIADDKVKVTPKGRAILSPASPINPEIMQAVEAIASEMWPGVPVIPTMSGGYTDSRWLRNAGIPSYGVSGLFTDPGNNGVHGRNEQVEVRRLYDSKEFLYRLVKRLAAPSRTTAQ
jgi:acetylornithine deacetylase/succinyl-diaminopimelate desuccinylase-like protein